MNVISSNNKLNIKPSVIIILKHNFQEMYS